MHCKSNFFTPDTSTRVILVFPLSKLSRQLTNGLTYTETGKVVVFEKSAIAEVSVFFVTSAPVVKISILSKFALAISTMVLRLPDILLS